MAKVTFTRDFIHPSSMSPWISRMVPEAARHRNSCEAETRRKRSLGARLRQSPDSRWLKKSERVLLRKKAAFFSPAHACRAGSLGNLSTYILDGGTSWNRTTFYTRCSRTMGNVFVARCPKAVHTFLQNPSFS